MKTVLIIYPHWVPANLAGVQRPRLIGNYLSNFDWKPLLLTVDSKYYEETPDLNLEKTVSEDIEVIYTRAYKIDGLRLVGDIGLRAFPFLYKEALKICSNRQIDFIWIPIPSFYTSILGRLLHEKTHIPYGIDYIDPWVRNLNNQNNIRAKLSQFVAKVLEPHAVKKADLISGVSKSYYWPVIERNFKIIPENVGMPYGFDPRDHEIRLKNIEYPWTIDSNQKNWIYAGAFLPNSHIFIKCFFRAVTELKKRNLWDKSIRLYFIGTGKYKAKSIAEYARDAQMENIVTEIRDRQPFLNILNFLAAADRVMLFGSTEKHYTASKTFQCLLSQRPLFTIIHEHSSAVRIIEKVGAAEYLVKYREVDTQLDIVEKMIKVLIPFQKVKEWNLELKYLNDYSSKKSAEVLAKAMDKIIQV